jgi:hypothetical protein
LIALDPNETTEFSLKSDANREAAVRPTFVTRFLTCRQVRQARANLSKMEASDSDEERVTLAIVTAGLGLVGWRNVGSPGEALAFDLDRIEDALTYYEVLELPYAMLTAVLLSETDRKNSARPSDSSTVPAAEAAVITA